MFVSGLSLTYLKSSRYYFLHLESRVSGTMYNIVPRSWVSVPTFRFLGLGSLVPPTSYFPVLDLRCHGTSVMVLQIGLRYWVLGLTKSSGFWVPLLWYVNNFGIIGKIIWFWWTFNKKFRVKYDVTRRYRISNFVKLNATIVQDCLSNKLISIFFLSHLSFTCRTFSRQITARWSLW